MPASYPDRSAATVNRQLYTPIIAVMNFAKHQHRHDSLPALDVPCDDWHPAVLRAANPWVRAFLITGRMHGRRPGELLSRTREHFDAERGTLLVYDRKRNQHILIELAGPALVAIKALPDLRDAAPGGSVLKRLTAGMRNALFDTFRKESMRAWLRDACKEAGVRYHMPKEARRAGEDWFAKIFSEPLQIEAGKPTERTRFLGDGVGDGRKKKA